PHAPTPFSHTLPLHDALPILDVASPQSLTLPLLASAAALYPPSVGLATVDDIVLPLLGSTAVLYAPSLTVQGAGAGPAAIEFLGDRKSTRLNSSHVKTSYAVL